jgi:hypothetical protein
VQEALHRVHAEQNSEGQASEEDEPDQHLTSLASTMGMPVKPETRGP